MSRIDRILDILDGAGQSSRERDVSEPETDVPDGRCWRCTRRDVADGSTVCAPCRVFLLGDGPDPDALERWARTTFATLSDAFQDEPLY